MLSVAFLGLGAIGRPIAKRIAAAKFPLTVWNRSTDRAASFARDVGVRHATSASDAAKDAGCWARVLERRTQGPDHPILLTMPETLYLKCFILEVIY